MVEPGGAKKVTETLFVIGICFLFVISDVWNRVTITVRRCN